MTNKEIRKAGKNFVIGMFIGGLITGFGIGYLACLFYNFLWITP